MKRIELKSIEDLALLASSSPFGSTIQHFKDGESHLYFMFGGTRKETYIFYVKSEKKIDHRFINLDITQNKIVYSDKPIIDPKFKVTPIIEVKKQDVFEDLL